MCRPRLALHFLLMADTTPRLPHMRRPATFIMGSGYRARFNVSFLRKAPRRHGVAGGRTRVLRGGARKTKRDREIGAARYDTRQFGLCLWRTLAAGSSAGGHASILPVALEDIGGRELVCGRAWNKSAGVPRKKRVRHKESERCVI